MKVDIFEALKNDETLVCDTTFIQEMSQMMLTRGKKLGLDPYYIFEALGERANKCNELAANEETHVNEKMYKAFMDETSKLVFLFSALIKFVYPMIEQMDTMIDRKITAIKHD